MVTSSEIVQNTINEFGIIKLWILTIMSFIQIIILLWTVYKNPNEYCNNFLYTYELFLKTLISPFQWRTRYLWKENTCCIAGCNTRVPESNIIQFCSKHNWIKVAHEKRHTSKTRLPVLLLVWDNTPYRHALAGDKEIISFFPRLTNFFFTRIKKIFEQTVEHFETKNCNSNKELCSFHITIEQYSTEQHSTDKHSTEQHIVKKYKKITTMDKYRITESTVESTVETTMFHELLII